MTRERVVVDTNVLISSLFFTTSTPAQAVDKAVTKGQLVATTETLRELIGKLHSPKFDPHLDRDTRGRVLDGLAIWTAVLLRRRLVGSLRPPVPAALWGRCVRCGW